MSQHKPCVSFSLEQCLQFESHKTRHKWKMHGLAVMSYPCVVVSFAADVFIFAPDSSVCMSALDGSSASLAL